MELSYFNFGLRSNGIVKIARDSFLYCIVITSDVCNTSLEDEGTKAGYYR